MDYVQVIVHVQCTFLGDSWVSYDACYQRQVATNKSLNRSCINFTIYNEAFARWDHPTPRYCFYVSEHHSSPECPTSPNLPPPRKCFPGYAAVQQTIPWSRNCAGSSTHSKGINAGLKSAGLPTCAWNPAEVLTHGQSTLISLKDQTGRISLIRQADIAQEHPTIAVLPP